MDGKRNGLLNRGILSRYVEDNFRGVIFYNCLTNFGVQLIVDLNRLRNVVLLKPFSLCELYATIM